MYAKYANNCKRIGAQKEREREREEEAFLICYSLCLIDPYIFSRVLQKLIAAGTGENEKK